MSEQPRIETGDQEEAENPASWLGLDYVHEQVVAQLQAQSDLWDAVDARLRLILGFIGIVFAAAIGLQRAAPTATGASQLEFLPSWAGTAAIIAVVVYLLAGLIVAWSIGQPTSIAKA
jgi:hypothetical protein